MRGKSKKIDYSKYGIYFALVVLVIFFSIMNSNFLTTGNVVNLLRQISVNGLISIGMTFVIITGGIDLSVGSVLGLMSSVMALLLVGGMPFTIVLPIVLVIGALFGMINGLLISKVKLQPFIVTLATMTIFRGVTYVLTNGKPISNLTTSNFFEFIGRGDIAGIPVPVIIFAAAFIGAYIILNKTVYGRNIYAIGGNETAAILSGLNANRIKTSVYVIAGFLSTLAGIILISRLNSAQPNLGVGYELDAIAAVVIGGTSLSGGRGKISGTLIGILIIGVISNGLNIMGVNAFYQEIIKGLIILGAVLLDRFNKEN
ncbi:MAG: ABC transporter permease [Mycoplasmatales bacterium]